MMYVYYVYHENLPAKDPYFQRLFCEKMQLEGDITHD